MVLAIGKIKVDTSVFESKLKIAHKYIGKMLEELESICNECGSVNTKIEKINSDGLTMYKVKLCNECDSSEVIDTEPIP